MINHKPTTFNLVLHLTELLKALETNWFKLNLFIRESFVLKYCLKMT